MKKMLSLFFLTFYCFSNAFDTSVKLKKVIDSICSIKNTTYFNYSKATDEQLSMPSKKTKNCRENDLLKKYENQFKEIVDKCSSLSLNSTNIEYRKSIRCSILAYLYIAIYDCSINAVSYVERYNGMFDYDRIASLRSLFSYIEKVKGSSINWNAQHYVKEKAVEKKMCACHGIRYHNCPICSGSSASLNLVDCKKKIGYKQQHTGRLKYDGFEIYEGTEGFI